MDASQRRKENSPRRTQTTEGKVMDTKETELPEIPESLRRVPLELEIIPDAAIEIERQFVTVEEEGGIPVNKE
jgi:hypothetical protein